MTQKDLQAYHEVVKEFSNERILVMAIPGIIRNSGKNVEVIQVTIGHNVKRKLYKYIYRDLVSNFRAWMKKKVDEIENK